LNRLRIEFTSGVSSLDYCHVNHNEVNFFSCQSYSDNQIILFGIEKLNKNNANNINYENEMNLAVIAKMSSTNSASFKIIMLSNKDLILGEKSFT